MAYASVNPATGETIRTFANHTDAEIQSALAAANALYKSSWSKGAIEPRLKVLERLADLIDARAEELAAALVKEMGKRISEARWEVGVTASIARYYATNAATFLAPEKLLTSQGEAWVEYHPIGVIVAVEPWNFPYYQLVRVAAPNIAIGNPVLAKHASIVPQAAVAFEGLVTEAGAPAGAWTNLFASGQQIASLIEDGRVQGVALTGSEKAGSAVASQAGKHLKKSVMELGGADVFVVLDDADLDRAVEIGANARLNVAGQACNAAKRFLVHAKVADRFLEKFTERFAATKVGDPMDETVGMGPLCSRASRDDIAAQVDRAVKAGATLHHGGAVIEGPGAFYQPTILTGITRDNPAYFEEFFGPVAQVYVVRDDDEAVELANDSNFGLSGAVFTADIGRAEALASRMETGSVWINTRSATAPELPFGGVKRSGYGRELSQFGIKEFVNQKMVVVARS
ncbi:MAG: NAD-dependent succinate-semialdehyde dehydrogenase [Reyranella sp.]|uniref:NAD-dependent succinate-semialdehyde dehydrogenase n=1 Tax=Reyranella sp. TaxID=1929291 RepID=UPI0011FCD2F6|nr:NAD-dependent succinate-semialdehyde dehydrogenase [Reyranella sp.]TAJ87232.1 MAG: NAD-dependent succinate-semialdehyde dehydrogenase [Reyranella sp.]TBR27290.1 MAG: NAD-dependent succinate-semialdehyde dehydrogenase [Reyranella sp.]